MQIHTERLLLRPIHKKDASVVFAYRSDKSTSQYQGWVPETLEDTIDFIQNKICAMMNRPGTWFQMVIINQENDAIIGDIGIHFTDEENKQAELGCTLDKKYQGKGYATEAMRAVINLLFNELNKHRISASIDPRNTESIKLVERLGFRLEEHFRESLLINGVWVDDLVYCILRIEWVERKRNDFPK